MTTSKRLYAQGTTVQSSKSRADIETLILKHGATSYASAFEGDRATVLFKMQSRRVRFAVDLTPNDERENMRRWRSLLFLLKAKLTAVEDGQSTFENEFLAYILVPGAGGETVAQWLGPQLAYAYDKGTVMPPLLGSGG
jgi:hypothetical protein